METKKTWKHTNAENRKGSGLPIEKQFAQEFTCGCGGFLRRSTRYWESDLTCDDCGKKFEVKSSPQIERTKNIAISAKAWSHYSEDTLIVTEVGGVWYAEDKQTITENCNCIHDTISSTHPETGGYRGNAYDSSFYLIPVSSLKVIGKKEG